MSNEDTQAIVFYDIASRKPRRTFGPNPWKTRLALNLKNVRYRTEWVELPDIATVREKLGVPANRTHPDGTPYHTLPLIHDPFTGALVGDSFEIAQYLDKTYPQSGCRLFHTNTMGLTAAYNARIDGVFTKYVTLCSQMQFDPAVESRVFEIFARRQAAIKAVEQPAEQVATGSHDEIMAQLQAAMGELAKAYRHTGGTTDYYWRAKGTADEQVQHAPSEREHGAVFLDGKQPTYADAILVAWLKMYEFCMVPEDWAKLRTWHGGFWGRIVDAFAEWCEIK